MTGTVGSKSCIFCDAPGREHEPLVVARGTHAYVILNLYRTTAAT